MEMVEELEDRSYMCALEVPVFICIHLDNERAIYKTDKIEKRFVKIATVGLLATACDRENLQRRILSNDVKRVESPATNLAVGLFQNYKKQKLTDLEILLDPIKIY